MKQQYSYLLKNIGLLTISNFSSKILVFLLIPLYTSVLNTAEYGIYDLVVGTIQLIMPIFTVNIIGAVMRFTMDTSVQKANVIEISLKYIIGGCLLMGIMLFFTKKLNLLMELNGMEYLVFFYFTFYVFNQFLIQFSKGLECIKDMAIAGFLGTVSMLISNILFLLVFQMGLIGFFIANILSQAIPVFYLAIKRHIWHYCILKLYKKSDEYIILKKNMLYYSIPLIFVDLGWWINNSFDRYVIAWFCGTKSNGLIAVAYKIPAILNVVQGIFTQAWQISAIKEIDSEESNNFYKQSYLYMSMIMCITCACLILLSKPIAYILYAKDFYEAWRYVPFLLVSSVFNAAAGYFGSLLAARKDSISMAKSAFYGAGANLVLDILLVKYIGIQGAAIATSVSSYIIYIIRKKAVTDIINFQQEKNINFSWILLCIQAFNCVYKMNIIIQILLFMGIIYIYASLLKLLVKKLFKKFKYLM